MREYTKEEVSAAIDTWIIGRNAERNRIILKRKLIDGISYDHLSSWLKEQKDFPPSYKLEVRQLKRIVYKGQEIIFRHLE